MVGARILERIKPIPEVVMQILFLTDQAQSFAATQADQFNLKPPGFAAYT